MTVKQLYNTNRVRFCGIIGAYLLSSAALVLNSYILMYLVEYIKTRDLNHWLQFFFLELIVSISSYFFPRMANYFVQKQIQEYNHSIRQKIIQSYYNGKKQTKVAEAQNRLINDIDILDSSYLSNYFFVVNDVATIIFSTIILFLINWMLFVVTAAVVGISLLLPKVLDKAMISATNNLSKRNQQYFNLLQNWLGGIDELRHFLAGSKLFSVMKNGQNELKKANVDYQEKSQLVAIINGFSSNLFSLVIYLVTGLLIQNKIIFFGTIIAIGNFHYYISGAIEDINFSLQQIKGTKELNASVGQEIQTEFKELKSKDNKLVCGLKLENISCNYDQKKIKIPDIVIKPGEKILLTGANGRGKSTLLDIISGIKNDFSGEIKFFDLTGKDQMAQDLQINYMLQKAKVFPGTYLENITMFDSDYNEKTRSTIKELELDKSLNTTDQTFSGGQEQIISILRHTIYPANFVLIDEGLSGVDDNNKEKILKYLQNLPTTLIFVEHNLDKNLKRYFDREITI